MKRTVWLEETKQVRFEEAYRGWIVRRLTQEEAAQLLNGWFEVIIRLPLS